MSKYAWLDGAWLRPFLLGAASALLFWALVGTGPAARLVGLIPAESKVTWYLTRSSGITAYLLLTLSMLTGLGVFTRLLDALTPRANSFTLHEHLSWLALGFTGLHAGVLVFDRYQPFRLAELLTPFLSAWRPAPVAFGILAMYAMVLVNVSFYLKPRLSHRAWQIIHFASYALFALATAHGVFAGSDSNQVWMQWFYLFSGAAVLFFTLYRILRAPREGRSGGGKAAFRGAAAPPAVLVSSSDAARER